MEAVSLQPGPGGSGSPLWCREETVAAGSGPVWQLCSWAWRGRSSSGTWRGRGAVTSVAEGRTETDYKRCARSFPLKAHDSGCRSFPSLSWDPPEIIETLRTCSWMFSEIWGWEGVMSVLPGASAGRRASACFHTSPDLSWVGQNGPFSHCDFSCRGLGPTSQAHTLVRGEETWFMNAWSCGV